MAYKQWTFGEKLYSPDLNSVVRQTVAPFASTADRDTAITAPYAGQMCFVTGLGHLTYSGTKWVPLPGTEIAHLYRATAQSVANNVYTAISFSHADTLRFGGWAATPNPSRFVAPFPGRYEFTYRTGWSASPTTQGIRLDKNSSTVEGSKTQNSSVGLAAVTGSCRLSLNGSTDYVEAMVLQVSGAALNTYTADGRPELRITYLGG